MVYPLNAEDIALFELFPGLGVNLGETLEKTVGNRGKNMHVLAVRQVVQESEQHYSVNPPEKAGITNQASCRNAREKSRSRKTGYGHIPGGFLTTMSNFTGVHTEKGNHQNGNQPQNNKGIKAPRNYVRRRKSQTADDRSTHCQKGTQRYQVKNEGQSIVQTSRQQREVNILREYTVKQELGIGNQQEHKAPEEDKVV
ncbi:hypothetical protein ES703_83880 [subsurface metagenome]